MKSTNEYLIPFVGLKLGKHQFEFKIEKKFYDEYQFDEFESSNIEATELLEKNKNNFEIRYKNQINEITCSTKNTKKTWRNASGFAKP